MPGFLWRENGAVFMSGRGKGAVFMSGGGKGAVFVGGGLLYLQHKTKRTFIW